MPRPEGLAVGRVVHFTPEASSAIPFVGMLQNGPIGGRISFIQNAEKGDCYLHLDVVPDVHFAVSLVDAITSFGGGSGPKATQVLLAQYDPDGKPGTWRYPPIAR